MSRQGLTGPSALISPEAAFRVSARVSARILIPGLDYGRILFPANGVGGIQFLVSCWTVGLSFLLVTCAFLTVAAWLKARKGERVLMLQS